MATHVTPWWGAKGCQRHQPRKCPGKGAAISPHGLSMQVRTENPGEANLFYVPALLYAKEGSPEAVRHVMQYVKHKHPELWGRNQGVARTVIDLDSLIVSFHMVVG